MLALLLAAPVLLLSWLRPRTRLLRHGGFSLLCLCAANAAVAARDSAPAFVSIVLAGTLTPMALIGFHAGARRLCALRPRFDFIGWLVAALIFGSFIWLTYFEPDMAARIILLSSLSALLIARLALLITMYSRGEKGSASSLLLAGLCWFVVIALTIMAITTAMRGEESQHLFETGPAVSSFFGIRPVLLIAITAAVLWVDFQALGSDRTDFERSSDREIEAGQRAFFAQCDDAISAAGSAHSPLSVMLIDLDNFKPVVKRHGFKAGAQVLRWADQTVQGALREQDSIHRYGPDQFAVLMPQTHQNSALAVAEDARKRIESGTCTINGKPLHLTASIGVARLQTDRATGKALAAAAIVALYEIRAKSGNNVGAAAPPYQKPDITQV